MPNKVALRTIVGTGLVNTDVYMSGARRNDIAPDVVEALREYLAIVRRNAAYLSSCLAATAEQFDRAPISRERKQLARSFCVDGALMLRGNYMTQHALSPSSVLSDCREVKAILLDLLGPRTKPDPFRSPVCGMDIDASQSQIAIVADIDLAQRTLVFVIHGHTQLFLTNRRRKSSARAYERNASIFDMCETALACDGISVAAVRNGHPWERSIERFETAAEMLLASIMNPVRKPRYGKAKLHAGSRPSVEASLPS